MRIIAVDVSGTRVIAVVEPTSPDLFDASVGLAAPILASVAFE